MTRRAGQRVRAGEADRRRRPRRRLRRRRARRRPSRPAPARLAVRHPRFAEVAPMLAEAGYRVIVPYLRGYGTTRFRSAETVRNGQQAALAVDAIALLDALGIRRGDRGRLRLGRPHRRHRGRALARALPRPRVGQRLPDRQPGSQPEAPAAGAELAWWYQFYFATERGRARLREVPARLRAAHLADRFAEMGVRRRHLRSKRRGLRQPRPRRHRDPQLPLADRPRRGRAEIRRAGGAARRRVR